MRARLGDKLGVEKQLVEEGVLDLDEDFHTSTSEVYGDPDVHPQPESYWGHVNTVGPRSCYDERVAVQDGRGALPELVARLRNNFV